MKQILFLAFILAPNFALACWDNSDGLMQWDGFSDIGVAIGSGDLLSGGAVLTNKAQIEDGFSGRIVCTTIKRVLEMRDQFSSDGRVALTGFSVDVAGIANRTVTLNFEFLD